MFYQTLFSNKYSQIDGAIRNYKEIEKDVWYEVFHDGKHFLYFKPLTNVIFSEKIGNYIWARIYERTAKF